MLIFHKHKEDKLDLQEYVAKRMYERPEEGDEFTVVWPPRHPQDRAYWLASAQEAINAIEDKAGLWVKAEDAE